MWTEQDKKLLQRVRNLHETQTAAAETLGIGVYQMSRYLSGKRAPNSELVISVLRTRMNEAIEKNRASKSSKKTS